MDIITYSEVLKLSGEIDALNDMTEFNGINFYDSTKQTSGTISPHYYYDGVPYPTTQFDGSFNCTALIPVEPNTKYTVGLVPAYNEITKPWADAGQGVFAYDENGSYIQDLGINGTFYTPARSKYIRFNYAIGSDAGHITLDVLNERCMLIKGDTLPSLYSDYGKYNIKDVLRMLIGHYSITKTQNLYDAKTQTPDTISPHYYVDGIPYQYTYFDNLWNCTALIPIEPNTKYTVGLVPPFGNDEIVKPWTDAGYGVFAYDENGDYLTTGGNLGITGTFTTPGTAKYIRFNYAIGSDVGHITLDVLNERCMLIKGDTLPETYFAYGTYLNGDIQKYANTGFEWRISEGNLYIAYGYDATKDYVVVLNNGRANGLFDFSKLCIKYHSEPLQDCVLDNLTTVWLSGTDMHSPFQFNAVNNADGYHYDATSAGFVGGNHTLDQLGTGFETAESKYVQFFADGTLVTGGYGRANTFTIRWANDVQAYNTVKQGGGGRACLTEYHEMIFDGVRFNETVKLVALEDIYMSLWYGLQFVSWGTKYTNLRYMDADNRTKYTSGSTNSGKLLCSGIEAWGTNDKIVLEIDNSFDLGKRENVSSLYTDGAFTSSSKGYFRIITKGNTNFTMSAGESYYLKGSFRFCKAIAE